MDHAQGRELHHHLARAIMHLNYIAGMLPLTLNRPLNGTTKWVTPILVMVDQTNLSDIFIHLFPCHPLRGSVLVGPVRRFPVRFHGHPAPSSVPTMVVDGGIPTHMVVNFRPLSLARRSHEDDGRSPTIPMPPNVVSDTPPVSGPSPNPVSSHVPTRTTTPVPVRSKQRSNHIDDSQPKKKPRSGGVMLHSSTSPPVNLPVITDVPHDGFNSDESEEEVASAVNPAHSSTASEVPLPTIPSAPPADRPNSPSLANTTSTTVPKSTTPHSTLRISQMVESDRGTIHSSIRPWTGAEDQELINLKNELINLKNDTKSRPSWETIGSRLRRDPWYAKFDGTS